MANPEVLFLSLPFHTANEMYYHLLFERSSPYSDASAETQLLRTPVVFRMWSR